MDVCKQKETSYGWFIVGFLWAFVICLCLGCMKNQELAARLEEVIKRGEEKLAQIQQTLQNIAQAQLQCQALDNSILELFHA